MTNRLGYSGVVVSHPSTAMPEQATNQSPLSNIDSVTAQQELDRDLLAHYILGRNLAMEEALKALISSLPPAAKSNVLNHLSTIIDMEMVLLKDDYSNGIEDIKQHVTKCGYIHSMLIIKG